ncbi:MAG: heparinase II/III domain-containing protein [Lentimonas sp.]
MGLAKYGRLYRTLRHLKGQQLFYQLLYRAKWYAFWEKPVASEGLSVAVRWDAGIDLIHPLGAGDCLSQEDWHFRFINIEHGFGSQIDWSAAPHGKLWNYNLHYFEWLWGLDRDAAKVVVSDWIDNHTFSKNAEGWEPYTLSLRVINWIGYWGTARGEVLSGDFEFQSRLFKSLGLQCDWLTKRLEKHILGNHYLENGVALWLAGTFFDGVDSDKWLRIGQQVLDEQLEEQMLEDGMHFERSPMYHNRFLWALGWLSAIDPEQFGDRYKRATEAARLLKHPDGKVALFNDSAFGVYPLVDGEAPVGTFSMEASGYYGARTKERDYLICDAGRIGPDYIPGHSHCDIGSFELSVGGARLVADTGVYHYLNTKERHYSRSTAAHNVFAPEGIEQAEIWSAFRVGDRPDVSVRKWDPQGQSFQLVVAHNGFEAVGASVEREFNFNGVNELTIMDRFSNDSAQQMVGYLHLSPDVEVLASDESRAQLELNGQPVEITAENVDSFTVEASDYYPEFNTCIVRPCIRYSSRERSGEVMLRISWKH